MQILKTITLQIVQFLEEKTGQRLQKDAFDDLPTVTPVRVLVS